MKYRDLGNSGIRVSEIGFGSWGIGGDRGGSIAYGQVDRKESIRALHSAMDVGINYFDTADFYGFGESESVIGEAVKIARDGVVIASKVGMITGQDDQNFEPSHIELSIENTLRRLRTDYLDVYQLHSPPSALFKEDSPCIRTLKRLKTRGLIREWGVSARNPDDAKTAIVVLGAPVIQVNFNLLDQRAMDCGLFDLAASRKIGLIIRTPLSFGFLTGQYSATQDFAKGDHRNQWSIEQKKRWAGARELFQGMIASDKFQTPAQFSLRFCLSFPQVSTLIPGMLTAGHVEENQSASFLGPLPTWQVAEIQKIYAENTFFVRNN